MEGEEASFMDTCPLTGQEDWIPAAPRLGILKHSPLEAEGRQEGRMLGWACRHSDPDSGRVS